MDRWRLFKQEAPTSISRSSSQNKNANNIRLYGDILYIFCDNILVTVFQIPTNMRNNIDDFLKK